MFVSQITGECGGLLYVLRHLISKGRNGLFFNNKWRYYVYREYNGEGFWMQKSFIKEYLTYIKTHKLMQVALALGVVGDILTWYAILFL